MKFEVGQHVHIVNSRGTRVASGKVLVGEDRSADGGFYESDVDEAYYGIELIRIEGNIYWDLINDKLLTGIPERALRAEDSLTQLARSVVEEAAE